MCNLPIYENGEKHENDNYTKCQNDENKKCVLPLRPENTIPYGRRGTP